MFGVYNVNNLQPRLTPWKNDNYLQEMGSPDGRSTEDNDMINGKSEIQKIKEYRVCCYRLCVFPRKGWWQRFNLVKMSLKISPPPSRPVMHFPGKLPPTWNNPSTVMSILTCNNRSFSFWDRWLVSNNGNNLLKQFIAVLVTNCWGKQ